MRESWLTFRMAFPIMVAQIGQILMQIIDTIMVGKLGVAPLAAAAFAGSLFSFFLLFGIGVSHAVPPLVARALGKNNPTECGGLLVAGLYVHIGLGIILLFLLYGCAWYMPLFGQPPEVTVLATPYLKIFAWNLIPGLIFQVYRQYYQGFGRTRMPMVVMLVGLAFNVGLNFVLIFGMFGFPRMGLNGAATATLISRTLMAIVIIYLIHKDFKLQNFLPKSWSLKESCVYFKSIIHLGIPSGFATFFEIGAISGSAILMGWISTAALAAHQIALNVASLTFMIPLGISSATSVRIGFAAGKNQSEKVREIGWTSAAFSAIIMLIFGIIIILTRKVLPYFYVNDPETISITADLLLIVALFQIFDGIQVTQSGNLRGLTDVKWPFFITLFSYWILSFPVAYVLGLHTSLGSSGVWWGLMLGLVVAAILLSYRFWWLSRNARS